MGKIPLPIYPIPTDHLGLLILSSIQPVELRQLGPTLFLTYRRSLDPDHILYVFLSESLDSFQEKLRTRCPFVPAAQNLLSNLAGLGIRDFQWTNYRWSARYCENTSRLCAFIPRTCTRPVGMSLPGIAWVKLFRACQLTANWSWAIPLVHTQMESCS